jgi:hypothetical protein
MVSRATALPKISRRAQPAQATPSAIKTLPAETPKQAYRLRTRLLLLLAAIAVGTLIAGFWNFKLVDGFGRNVVAANTVGNPDGLSGAFAEKGFGFGFIFAAIAGLAATFTACNCVAFTMIPGLACSTDGASTRRRALAALGALVSGIVLVGAIYGAFIGLLGPDGIKAFNSRAVSLAQAQTVFTAIGIVMILWAALALGFLDGLVSRLSPATRAFFAQATVRSLAMGVLIGLFAVGRPFPVFRDLLVYAATAKSPLYGAGVMMIQGLGQVAVMVALFLAVVLGFGGRLTRWGQRRPYQPALVSALALAAGGMYFIFYWGIALGWNLGSWGVKLGWYH